MAHAEHDGAVENVKKWIFNYFTVCYKSTDVADIFWPAQYPRSPFDDQK